MDLNANLICLSSCDIRIIRSFIFIDIPAILQLSSMLYVEIVKTS